MVHKIVYNRFRVFVESFLLACVILLVGFSLGFFVENYRTSKVIADYRANEIESLDLKLQNYYYQIMDQSSCDSAIEQNFVFADKIYLEGLNIEKFEEMNQISEDIKIEKKKYVLLKTELWLNTLLLKEKCNADFDIAVYFYSSDPSDTVKVAEQKILSNVLKEIKEERGNKLVLIPLAGDLDLQIVDLQMKNYKITELPSILINEKNILIGFNSKENIEKYLSSSK
ncbi:hypothetical protein J4474_02940 [Candidatus Pacearchaeota archaeon]|nr:hypothetical protein [Candidatus Pacearchaeota archaeon]